MHHEIRLLIGNVQNISKVLRNNLRHVIGKIGVFICAFAKIRLQIVLYLYISFFGLFVCYVSLFSHKRQYQVTTLLRGIISIYVIFFQILCVLALLVLKKSIDIRSLWESRKSSGLYQAKLGGILREVSPCR